MSKSIDKLFLKNHYGNLQFDKNGEIFKSKKLLNSDKQIEDGVVWEKENYTRCDL